MKAIIKIENLCTMIKGTGTTFKWNNNTNSKSRTAMIKAIHHVTFFGALSLMVHPQWLVVTDDETC
jgi:hypothetical protein